MCTSFIWGFHDPKSAVLASCARRDNLHRYAHRTGNTLPVEITTVPVPSESPGVGRFRHGHSLCFIFRSGWSSMAFTFWRGHKLQNLSDVGDMRQTIPVLIHWDEGSGQCKRPVLVLSFQNSSYHWIVWWCILYTFSNHVGFFFGGLGSKHKVLRAIHLMWHTRHVREQCTWRIYPRCFTAKLSGRLQ